MTVQSEATGLGEETVFEFKYVPQLGMTTKRAALPPQSTSGLSGGAQRSLDAGESGQRSADWTRSALRTALVGVVVAVGLRSVVRLGVVLW